MGSNEFFYLKAGLEKDGYEESTRKILDWFTRDYIRNHDCPECDRHGLESIILRSPKGKRLFGKCKGCGEVTPL